MYWISELGVARLAIAARPQGGDLLESEIRCFREEGVDVVVSALTFEEIEELGLTREPDYCGEHGITFKSFPIPDHAVPDSYQAVRILVEGLSMDLLAGKGVLIHCLAGVGRSALLAACTLCVTGLSVNRALELISRARGLIVPETVLQRVWVDRFVERMQTSAPAK